MGRDVLERRWKVGKLGRMETFSEAAPGPACVCDPAVFSQFPPNTMWSSHTGLLLTPPNYT